MSGERRALLRTLRVAALVACLGVRAAHAAGAAPPQDAEGYVLSIEGGDVIVDLGAARGVVDGDTLELWRAIELVHPVTRKPVRDRYRVGTLRVVQVRDRFTVTVVEGTKRPPAPGDTVILRRVPEAAPARATPARPVPEPAAPIAVAPPSDAETARVVALFESLKEATLVDRIRAYIAFVRKYPKSPYSPVLHEDAVHYHRLLRAQRQAEASSVGAPRPAEESAPERAVPAPAVTSARLVTEFEAPERALSGKPFDLGIHFATPVAGAVLQVRSPGEVGYRPLPMTRAGGGHFRATLPADRIRPPGIQYFIEGVDPEGHAVAVQGTEDLPLTLEVERDPDSAPKVLQERTTVSFLSDYADFNTLKGKHDDWTFQNEGQLGMRFGDIGVRALRTGFGVYRGQGGSLYELDDLKLEPRAVGLTYGQLEGEFAFHRLGAIVARFVCGLTEEGVEVGALGLVRIGSDLGTNLALGGEILGGFGVRSITQLEIRELPRVPFLVRSEVSNQPAGATTGARAGSSQAAGDIGLRTIVQAGYEFFPGFVVSIRGSAQGRTINHYGFGGGGAVSYSW